VAEPPDELDDEAALDELDEVEEPGEPPQAIGFMPLGSLVAGPSTQS
jgi:hypothetical protein